ncbi:MAG: hypothetical protein JWM57_2696 [Phycisphaerales bacterium]|nr:hypothetical protein [Phycisphaerales bacterium]
MLPVHPVWLMCMNVLAEPTPANALTPAHTPLAAFEKTSPLPLRLHCALML